MKNQGYYVQKETYASMGRGIKISNQLENFNYSVKSVSQEYLNEPALINNRKFDIRYYIMMTSIDTLIG